MCKITLFLYGIIGQAPFGDHLLDIGDVDLDKIISIIYEFYNRYTFRESFI